MSRPSVAERLPRMLAVLAFLHQEGSASVQATARRATGTRASACFTRDLRWLVADLLQFTARTGRSRG